MAKVKEIFAVIDSIAPFDSQMDFDRAGFLVGNAEADVQKALLALDVTKEVVDEAVELGCQLIISHHPVIWDPIKRLMSDSLVYKLAQNNLSVISAHTNLDKADEGVNDCLARKIGLINTHRTECPGCEEIGTYGELPEPLSARDFAIKVRDALGCDAVQYTEGRDMIKRVTVIGGGGGDFAMPALESEADAVVTGEAKHNQLVDIAAAGKTLIVAGHFETEVIVMPHLAEMLAERTNGTEYIVSRAKSPARFV